MDLDGYLVVITNEICQGRIQIYDPRMSYKQLQTDSSFNEIDPEFFLLPLGLCVDDENLLYVSDLGHHRIHVSETKQ